MNILIDKRTPGRFRDWVISRMATGEKPIDAVLEWCEVNEVEPETVQQFVDGPLKERLLQDGIQRKLLERCQEHPSLDV